MRVANVTPSDILSAEPKSRKRRTPLIFVAVNLDGDRVEFRRVETQMPRYRRTRSRL